MKKYLVLLALACGVLVYSQINTGGTGGGGGAATWGAITGTLSSQSDLNTALGLKAPLASPALTGVPTAPTAALATNTTQVATTAGVVAATVPPGNWYANFAGATATGAVLSATVNKAGMWGQFLDRPVTTGHIAYEVGTTADNTAATYDIGVYTGTPAGTCTLIADIGPTAGTTFAPATSTFVILPWAQGTVTIPAGRVYFALTTSQTGAVAAMFRIGSPNVTGTFQFNTTALSIATGGTLPPSATCPADSNSGAGVTIANVPAIVLQP